MQLAAKTKVPLARFIRAAAAHDFRFTNVEKVLAEQSAEEAEKQAPAKRKGGAAAAAGKVWRAPRCGPARHALQRAKGDAEEEEEEALVELSDLEHDEPMPPEADE